METYKTQLYQRTFYRMKKINTIQTYTFGLYTNQ